MISVIPVSPVYAELCCWHLISTKLYFVKKYWFDSMIGKLHYYRITNLNEDKANRMWLHLLFLPPLPSLPVTWGVCSSTLYGHWTFLKSQGTWRLRLFSIRSSWFLPLLELFQKVPSEHVERRANLPYDQTRCCSQRTDSRYH